jgi:polyisoprenoid-binding protein YceI
METQIDRRWHFFWGKSLDAATGPAHAPSMAPAGQDQLEKSHARLVLRVNHMGFGPPLAAAP